MLGRAPQKGGVTDADPVLLAAQVELERLYNKNQLLPRIKQEFRSCKEPDFLSFLESTPLPIEFGIDLLAQMVIHKRTTLSTLVGILRWHFGGQPDDVDNTASQMTADALLLAAQCDLVDWDSVTEKFVVKFDIGQELQDELNRFQYPLPMVIEPRTVTRNSDSAYLTGGGSLILKHNHHEDDICLDHINRVNRIRLAIDHRTAQMIENKWRNLDKPKTGETQQEFEKRQRAFEKYDTTARDVLALLSWHTDVFFLTHKYDKRGRTYCQGYHVNYQGAPWNKASVELADKELIQ